MKSSILKKFTKKNTKPYPRHTGEEEDSSDPEHYNRIGNNSKHYNKIGNNSEHYNKICNNSLESIKLVNMTLTLTLDPLKYIEKLQPFDGRREDLYTFLTNVDGIIPTLNKYDTASQVMCINILKSKLIGKAKRCMEIHSHLELWSSIKELLITNFGGFESSLQLYDKLRQTTYKGNAIQFYNDIQKNLCELNQKTVQEQRPDEITNNNATALSIFKEKLPVHMRTVLFALKPANLQEALHELTQAGFVNESRTEETAKKLYENPKPQNKQNNNFPQRQNNYQNQNFHPKNPTYIRPPFNHNPNPNYKGNNYNPNYKPHSRQCKPMEVDPTSSQLRKIQVNHSEGNNPDFPKPASETSNSTKETCPLLN